MNRVSVYVCASVLCSEEAASHRTTRFVRKVPACLKLNDLTPIFGFFSLDCVNCYEIFNVFSRSGAIFFIYLFSEAKSGLNLLINLVHSVAISIKYILNSHSDFWFFSKHFSAFFKVFLRSSEIFFYIRKTNQLSIF